MDLLAYAEPGDDFVEDFGGFKSRLHVDPASGHAVFQPIPDGATLGRFYNGGYERPQKPISFEAEFTPEVINVATGLRAHMQGAAGLGETFNFHEVGCGVGRLVWAMQQIGVSATGNEANAAEVEFGNQYCQGKLTSLELDQALLHIDHEIDLFAALHVLEHMPDPVAALRTMAGRLSPGGVVYICVPNGNSLLALLGGRKADPCYNFPGHLHYFTPKSLTNAVRSAGLEPLLLQTRSLPFYDGGAGGCGRALGGAVELMPSPTSWSEACCANLLGYELFCLATLPGNVSAPREPDIDERAEKALKFFQSVRGS